jgi:Lrp/AsnC family leucine-responsive transcriptional regulator
VFEARLRDLTAVTEALHATGDHDYVVRLLCRDTGELHTVLRGLKADAGAARTATRVVLDESVPRRPRLR